VLILHGLLHSGRLRSRSRRPGKMARRERLLRARLGLPEGPHRTRDRVSPLAAVETLASYISRVYSEFGKILTRESRRIWTPGRSWSSRNWA
jgi:hypothetical protein